MPPDAPSATKTPGDHTQPDTALLPAAGTHCWALPMPLHMARLDGEAAEEHILRSLD